MVARSQLGLHHCGQPGDIEPTRVAAIIVEPVQGEGGFYVMPAAFSQALRKLCDQQGIVLIADEIQTGFARTGRQFAMQHFGVLPGLMTTAKSLAGGLPLSAVTGRAELMDAPAPGGLGGTYAGTALSVAAAHAVLDVIAAEKLCDRAASLGERLSVMRDELRKDVPAIAEVRGLGSMILGACRAWGASAANRPQRSISHRLFAP